ncbi:MAG: G5 domain-containing protein [Clostridia bacterium]|nr:G5 domain-containing protein [Clostridia bacterium]
MEQCKKCLTAVRRVVCSRLFAALVMGAFTVSMALGISVSSRAVTVNDGDESRVVLTMSSDPYKVLSAAGVVLDEHDSVEMDDVSDTLDVTRAMAVEVQADGISTLLHLTEGTAADAIERAGITVGADDKVNVKLSAPLSEGMLIAVDRIAYQEYTVTEVIDYETTTKYTSIMRPGNTKVMTHGEEGERTITYRKTIVNGKVTSTDKVGETVTKQPVTKVVLKGAAYGTPYSKAPFEVELDAKGQPLNYKQKFSGSCTAYSSGTRGASGMRLGVGTVAVNPKQIPYGTKLWIASPDGSFVYGYAIAADTGGFAIRGTALVDVYMGSYTEACQFGRREMNVYVIG